MTGGITGFIGTYLCGPRIGLFSKDKRYAYVLDEANFNEEVRSPAVTDKLENAKLHIKQASTIRRKESLSPRVLLEQAIIDGELDVINEQSLEDSNVDAEVQKLRKIVRRVKNGARKSERGSAKEILKLTLE